MSANAIHPDATDRRRFWIWLVAAVLALVLLCWVVESTNRQIAPPVYSSRIDSWLSGPRQAGSAGGQERERL